MNKSFTLTFECFRDKSTTYSEKVIFSEILNLSMLDKGCIALDEHFAELMGIDKTAVSRLLNSLKKKGYISIYKKPGSRNHDRKITIDKMLIGMGYFDKMLITKCQETKESNIHLIKKNTKKENEFDTFLSELKNRVKIKSKVTKTKEGEELFKGIKDKNKLMNAYIKHQKEKDNYAQRITAFMMDYDESVKVNKVKRYV